MPWRGFGGLVGTFSLSLQTLGQLSYCVPPKVVLLNNEVSTLNTSPELSEQVLRPTDSADVDEYQRDDDGRLPVGRQHLARRLLGHLRHIRLGSR